MRKLTDNDYAEEMSTVLAERISALEEIIATMSLGKLLRLRRQLRRSIKGYGWAGPTFTDQRSQSVGDTWLAGYQARQSKLQKLLREFKHC